MALIFVPKGIAFWDKMGIAPTRVFSPINGRKNTLSVTVKTEGGWTHMGQ